MSGPFPGRPAGLDPEPPHPTSLLDDLTREERLKRWEVHAARWRARELAEATFGGSVEATLLSPRTRGPIRGLVRLDVPFLDLRDHRERETLFMAAVGNDALLSRIPLVYAIGPRAA